MNTPLQFVHEYWAALGGKVPTSLAAAVERRDAEHANQLANQAAAHAEALREARIGGYADGMRRAGVIVRMSHLGWYAGDPRTRIEAEIVAEAVAATPPASTPDPKLPTMVCFSGAVRVDPVEAMRVRCLDEVYWTPGVERINAIAVIRQRIAALRTDPVPTVTPVPRGHCNRCSRCGWPFGADAGQCRAGDCSMRPMPAEQTTCAGCGAPLESGGPASERGTDE